MTRLRRDRNPPTLKRALVSPKIGVRRRQKGDVARLKAAFNPVGADNGESADQPRAQLGHGLRFSVALLIGRCIAMDPTVNLAADGNGSGGRASVDVNGTKPGCSLSRAHPETRRSHAR